MDVKIGPDTVCAVSQDVVAREIEGELIIVPLAAGIGDLEDELLHAQRDRPGHLGAPGRPHPPARIACALAAEYDAPPEEIERGRVGAGGGARCGGGMLVDAS